MRRDQREPFCAADNFKRFSVHLFNSVCQRLLRCVMFGSLASFSLLNLHLILVIFDVLAQVAFVRFLVSQSPLCSSNFFSSRNVIQQVINIAIMLFKAQHGLSASRFFRFRRPTRVSFRLSKYGPHNKPSSRHFRRHSKPILRIVVQFRLA